MGAQLIQAEGICILYGRTSERRLFHFKLLNFLRAGEPPPSQYGCRIRAS